MFDVITYQGKLKIPFVHLNFEITYDGLLYLDNELTTLHVFNELTNLNIESLEVLQLVTYHKFNWAPNYWQYLTALKLIDGNTSPENMILGIKRPVESLEYPGYYLIPYFSNYVISKTGLLLKKSDSIYITASLAQTKYYTFRMSDDGNSTGNRLRHRILGYAFLPYPAEVETLDINHIDGIPGNDNIDNLEWTTRSVNNTHAVNIGLRSDNKEVQIYDTNTQTTLIFPSYSMAGRYLNVTETTISNRVKSNGYKCYDGYQFRNHPCADPWPVIENSKGDYLVTFTNGTTKLCTAVEAARLCGVTRTSLLRLIREGRNRGTNGNMVTYIKSSCSESCNENSL